MFNVVLSIKIRRNLKSGNSSRSSRRGRNLLRMSFFNWLCRILSN